MELTVDLRNPADIRAALDLLPRYLPPEAASDHSIEERFVNDLWSRLGPSMRKLVKKVPEASGPLTIEALASTLGRPPRSVRSSLNGPLARAIKSAKHAAPGAPDLFVWRHNGSVYELRLTESLREALASKNVEGDFSTMPSAE